MSFFVATSALGELAFEAAPLLFGIVELAEGVADLEASNKNLETFDPVSILFRLALVFRQRGNGERKVVNERRLNEMRLGDKFKDFGHCLAAGCAGIVGKVRVMSVVAPHQHSQTFGSREVFDLRLRRRVFR